MLIEWRCSACGKLLGHYRPAPGAIFQTMCRNSHCKIVNRLEITTVDLAQQLRVVS